jgi:hypothetical protein
MRATAVPRLMLVAATDKEPDYQVDDAEGRVFNLRNSKELSAFSVDAAPPVESTRTRRRTNHSLIHRLQRFFNASV